ncbi:hypothetical protein FGIG_12559 [Fasciola gigantica]|uniref:Uncharacterized protein n=1 Tax=Fasciola gigantica TaxID=46835 RepID=A0A504Z1T9_FASGI|nr:hypothetical protein FGIG_12559 [Fasciola gigantica]
MEPFYAPNSIPRQSYQTGTEDSTEILTIVNGIAGMTRLLYPLTSFQSSSTESPIWQESMDTEHISDPSCFGTGSRPGSSGDTLAGTSVPSSAVMGSQYVTRRPSDASGSGIASVGPVALNQEEPVGQTAAGFSASAGPDSSQLDCARLNRTLDSEIVYAVDRYLQTPTSV